jgi:hypothetical protein
MSPLLALSDGLECLLFDMKQKVKRRECPGADIIPAERL